MTALAAARNTSAFVATDVIDYPMKGSTTIYQGSLVVMTAGYAKPGVTELGARALGRAEETKTNSGADGATTIKVRAGVFNWTNGDSIAQADLPCDVYITDDQTVAKANLGTKSKAGVALKVSSTEGVWVLTNPGNANLDDDMSTLVQGGTGTLTAGVLTVATGITVTANTRVVAMRKTIGGTVGDAYDAPSADRVVGGPGVGTIVIRSYTTGGTAATSDTSTLDYILFG